MFLLGCHNFTSQLSLRKNVLYDSLLPAEKPKNECLCFSVQTDFNPFIQSSLERKSNFSVFHQHLKLIHLPWAALSVFWSSNDAVSAPEAESSKKRKVIRRVILIGQTVDFLQLRLADQWQPAQQLEAPFTRKWRRCDGFFPSRTKCKERGGNRDGSVTS